MQNYFTDSTSKLPVFIIIAFWVEVKKHSTEVRVWVVDALNNFNNISCGMHFICSKKKNYNLIIYKVNHLKQLKRILNQSKQVLPSKPNNDNVFY